MIQNKSSKEVPTPEIIWAFGPKSRYAHAYLRSTIETGIPLCGIRCTPILVCENFNPDNPALQSAVCPVCRRRLAFAKFAKPLRGAENGKVSP